MIEVQRKAGTAPETTGTWIVRLDSCVVRFPVWPPCARESDGTCSDQETNGLWAKDQLEFYTERQRLCTIHGGAAIKKERARKGACVRVGVAVCLSGARPHLRTDLAWD